MNKLLETIKWLTPPLALDIYRRLSGKYEFVGNYSHWHEALAQCSGYDAEVILDRVKESLLKVVNGEAAFERDARVFDQPLYWWPLVAALLWVASKNDNRLNLLDFGGSLGSVYFQNRKFLNHLENLNWSVVEQQRFVECGRRHFRNEHLDFFVDIEECTVLKNPDAVLLSGVLQYMEKPYGVLAEVVSKDFRQVIVDRTPFIETANDRIVIQKVPSTHYPGSYPAWLFSTGKFLDYMTSHYEMVAEFDSFDQFRERHSVARAKGFIFHRR